MWFRLLHAPGSSKSQVFSTGMQEVALLMISSMVYTTMKILMPWRMYLFVNVDAVPNRRRSRRLMAILERPLPSRIGNIKAQFHFRTLTWSCSVKWVTCLPKPDDTSRTLNAKATILHIYYASATKNPYTRPKGIEHTTASRIV